MRHLPVILGETALGRPVTEVTLHHIHATLRAALNGAVRAGLIASNPARHPEPVLGGLINEYVHAA